MSDVMEKLMVYPERMMENIELTRGLIYSQKILLLLVDSGMTREDAYRHVQKAAMSCWKDKTLFLDELLKEKAIVGALGKETIENSFKLEYHLKNIEHIFKKVGL
jgi:adenylosuccinate lyase